MLKKIGRYIRCLSLEECKHTTLRIIFQTPGMETAFWLHLLLDKPEFSRHLRILTTHLSLLGNKEHFMEPIYVGEDTITLERQGRVVAKVVSRIKLFSFL